MFTAESDSERILKIGQHLPKLWAIKYRVVFYETPCIYNLLWSAIDLQCPANSQDWQIVQDGPAYIQCV